jgi:hypothetical protein
VARRRAVVTASLRPVVPMSVVARPLRGAFAEPAVAVAAVAVMFEVANGWQRSPPLQEDDQALAGARMPLRVRTPAVAAPGVPRRPAANTQRSAAKRIRPTAPVTTATTVR